MAPQYHCTALPLHGPLTGVGKATDHTVNENATVATLLPCNEVKIDPLLFSFFFFKALGGGGGGGWWEAERLELEREKEQVRFENSLICLIFKIKFIYITY